MGLYEIENIVNANICTIVVNTKEYFEKFKYRSINKKHKGVRCNAKRIIVLREAESKRANKKMIQKGLQVKNTEMKMTCVSKVQFDNLNNN